MQPSPTSFEKLSRQLNSAHGKIKWYLGILERHQLSALAEGKAESCYPVCWTKDMGQAIEFMGFSWGKTKRLVHYLKVNSFHLFTQAADLTWYKNRIFGLVLDQYMFKDIFWGGINIWGTL